MDTWIGLGSNLGKPALQLITAIDKLASIPRTSLMRCSGFYRSAPWGMEDQDDFLNAVVVLETEMTPQELLRVLMQIESDMGRERLGDRWGPRCIDLDILTYNDLQLHSPDLELPHPRMHLRAFVLRPVLELEPDFMIPGRGSAALYLSGLEPQEVTYLGPAGYPPNRNISNEK